MRFTDNRSHSSQQFSAHMRQLFHKLPDKSAILLIHLFFLGVQAVNKVCGCDMWLEMTGSNKPPLPSLSFVGFAFCSPL